MNRLSSLQGPKKPPRGALWHLREGQKRLRGALHVLPRGSALSLWGTARAAMGVVDTGLGHRTWYNEGRRYRFGPRHVLQWGSALSLWGTARSAMGVVDTGLGQRTPCHGVPRTRFEALPLLQRRMPWRWRSAPDTPSPSRWRASLPVGTSDLGESSAHPSRGVGRVN